MKKQKIIITGGLGYIGSELCKLYSGETRYKDITVIDNRFISERVTQLKAWGFNFIQASILDENKVKELIKDADIIYHLAGITDVAYVKTEANSEQDKKIIDTAINGTNNIINNISPNTKLIFPSTHVVFEGLKETKLNLTEDEKTYPILTYASSKVQNEIDIINSNINYVILRLGSVYGYSTDTMRIGIMPNLFSKMTSQNQNIKLFSGGIQYKSLVNVVDVSRCFKFMGESKNIDKETFHLVNEQMTVKDVANVCKKYNPNIELIETNDEIPNLGYTLSNEKLLSTGFKFLYNLEDSIKEMVKNWSTHNINPELEYILQGQKEFIDDRGKISNYELTEPINLIGYIESTKGSVRANHYHPIQEQKCLLIKGKYISVIKDLSDANAPIKTQLIKAGDLSVIKPNVVHAMVFLEDSIFLNLVRGDREHDNYGITHTIPYKLVDDKFRDELINNYSIIDRVSLDNELKPVLSLGLSPLANNLVDSKDEKVELFPLEVMYNPKSHNCQLSYVVPSNKMFDNYLYVSSTAKSFRDHFRKACELYIDKFNLNSNSFIVDIGSNDGVALKPFQENNIKVLGIEPAKNIAELANKSGISTLNEYFTKETINNIPHTADLVLASNVFAHADDLESMTHNVFKILKLEGTFIIEVQYLLDTIKDLTFDNIYHEHTNYWSVTSLNNFFKRLGYQIIDVEHINTHGGSIRVYIQKNSDKVSSNVNHYLKYEEEFGLTKFSTYTDFAKKVERAKNNVINNITKLKINNTNIVGYGAPAKATTVLNYYNITETYIDYIIEDNELKHNKYIPGVNIPIKSKTEALNNPPDIIIVLAWNFFEEICNNNQELTNKGVKFINIKDLQNAEYSL